MARDLNREKGTLTAGSLFQPHLLFRPAEKRPARQKKHQDAENAVAFFACEIGEGPHQKRSEDGGKFPENVVESEKLRGFVVGNRLAEIGPAQGLNTALGGGHQHGKGPEHGGLGAFAFHRRQKKGQQHHPAIDENPDEDHLPAGPEGGQSAVDQGAGKRDDLNRQQDDEQGVLADAHGHRNGGGHADDGVDPFDVEKIGAEEKEDVLIFLDVFQGGCDPLEAVGNRGIRGLDVVFLADVFEHGNGEAQPPETGDDKRQAHRRAGVVEPEPLVFEDQHQPDNEGDGAADVSPAESGGRDRIHSVTGGDIHQKGVVEEVGAGETDHRQAVNADGQKPLPVAHQRERKGRGHPQSEKDGEKSFFPILIVGYSPQYRGQAGDHGTGDGVAEGPGSDINLFACQGFVKQRKYGGGNDNGIGRIGPVVQNPAEFFFALIPGHRHPLAHH